MGAEAAEGGGADANREDGQEEEEEELWVPDDLVVMPCHAMPCRAMPWHGMQGRAWIIVVLLAMPRQRLSIAQ